jgi:hypothetical protein
MTEWSVRLIYSSILFQWDVDFWDEFTELTSQLIYIPILTAEILKKLSAKKRGFYETRMEVEKVST